MKIAILGAGHIGSMLGAAWTRAGHDVVLVARDAAAVAATAARIGATSDRLGTAAAQADVVVGAVPFTEWPTLAPDLAPLVAGKPVVDATNLYALPDSAIVRAVAAQDRGSSGYVQRLMPDARVVKAMNMLAQAVLLGRAGEGLGIALAGDDASARDVAARLVTDAGFVPVVLPALADGMRFAPGTTVYNAPQPAADLATALGITLEPARD